MERVARAVRQTPMVVWSITALWLIVLLAYSILLPMFRAPDEPHHIDLANLFAEEQRYPAWDDRDLGTGVYNALDEVRFNVRSSHLTEDEAPVRRTRPSLDDLAEPGIETSVNQIPQHPPLYYVLSGTVGWAARAVVDDPAFDLEGWLYRVVSVLIVTPLPLIIWHVARMMGLPTVVGVAATLVPFANPQLTHIGSAVNNDSLMILTFWLLTPVILRLADGQLTVRVGVLAGVVTGLGLLTKGFTLVLPFWVVGALLLALRRGGRDRLRPALVTGAAFSVAAFVVGGWWWVRNLLVYGELNPSRYSEMVPNVDDVDVRFGTFLENWATNTTRRFWGEFGWFDVSIPSLAVGAASVLAIAGLVIGCRRRDRVAGTPVGNRVLLVAPLLLLVALQFFLAFRGYLQTGRMPGLQGRYWFGSVAAFALVTTIGFANVARRGTRFLPLATLVAAAAMQVAATLTILRYYWGFPNDSLRNQLRAVVAWSPIDGQVVAVGAVLGAAVLVATVVQIVRLTLHPPDDPTIEVDEEADAGERGAARGRPQVNPVTV